MFTVLLRSAALAVLCASTSLPRTFQYSPQIQIGYDVQGTGPMPVVLLHGLAGSKEMWDLLTPRLLMVCDCTVYRLDLRGHGESSAPDDQNYSVAENARIVRAFLAHENLTNVVLVGQSYGGSVALDAALDMRRDDPGRLGSLVLMSTPGINQRFSFIVTHHKYEKYGAVLDRITPSEFRAFMVVHAANPRFTEGTNARLKLYSKLWKDRDRTRAARRTSREFLESGLRRLSERSHDTGVPTLVIAGSRDHLVRLNRSRELANTIPGSRIEVIKGTGHALHEDAPDQVVPVLATFIHQRPVTPATTLAERR